ncbi:MAG: hypothetical protein ACLR8P_21615 [Clostridium fessum]
MCGCRNREIKPFVLFYTSELKEYPGYKRRRETYYIKKEGTTDMKKHIRKTYHDFSCHALLIIIASTFCCCRS